MFCVVIASSLFSCVPNVACLFELFIPDCLFAFLLRAKCCLSLWIIHSWLPLRFSLACPMLPVSLNSSFPFLIASSLFSCVPIVACVSVISVTCKYYVVLIYLRILVSKIICQYQMMVLSLSSNTADAPNGEGTAFPSEAPEYIKRFFFLWSSYCSVLSVLCIIFSLS